MKPGNFPKYLHTIAVALFLCKNIFQISSKTVDTHSFVIGHLNHKTVSKETRRKPSVNPRQLCAHQLKSFSTVMIIF